MCERCCIAIALRQFSKINLMSWTPYNWILELWLIRLLYWCRNRHCSFATYFSAMYTIHSLGKGSLNKACCNFFSFSSCLFSPVFAPLALFPQEESMWLWQFIKDFLQNYPKVIYIIYKLQWLFYPSKQGRYLEKNVATVLATLPKSFGWGVRKK